MATKNYTLGRGKLSFAPFKAGTKEPDGFRYMGNSPTFGVTVDVQELEHYDADEGVKVLDESVVLQANRTGSLVLDDIQPDNVALFLFSQPETISVTAQSGLTETFTGVKLDRSYKIGISSANPSGVLNVDPATFVAKVGATTLVAGTDYELDAKRGKLTLLEGATNVSDGNDVDITYDILAYTRSHIAAGSEQVEGALLYEEFNPVGKNSVWYFPYVKVNPNGDMTMKGDDWRQIPLSVKILKPADGHAIYQDNVPIS